MSIIYKITRSAALSQEKPHKDGRKRSDAELNPGSNGGFEFHDNTTPLEENRTQEEPIHTSQKG
jgi:hypothetical protein